MRVRPVKDRLWEKVQKGPGCWEWTGALDTYGYGLLAVKRKPKLVHRLVWEMTHGDPGDLHVLHTCDNRKCCNPDHLFLGTNADNVKDRMTRGRQPRGETHHMAKYSDADLKEMKQLRQSGLSLRAVGARFGASSGYVCDVLKGNKRCGTQL